MAASKLHIPIRLIAINHWELAIARGGKPRSDQSRASAKYIYRWAKALDIENILIENVPEFLFWGPLDPITLKPIKN